ncbi:MAG: hypothetical protein H6837_05735 [Planctomycetes bacterium]|nr:hypothetical protein [Planctomycetota bacterium]
MQTGENDKAAHPQRDDPHWHDPRLRRLVALGFWLLAVFVPIGLALEALHAFKVDVYLGSRMRQHLWTLAHAHGSALGFACLVYGAAAARFVAPPARGAVARWLGFSAVLMPLGFFLGGIGNREGDPSLAILLVPVGGLLLLVALLRAGVGCCKVDDR